MYPLLTFSTGLLVGVAAVRWLKNGKATENAAVAQDRLRKATASGREKAASGLETAQHKLRDAAISSLSAVETSSARLRTKLTPSGVVAPDAEVNASSAPAPNQKTSARRSPGKKSVTKAAQSDPAKPTES